VKLHVLSDINLEFGKWPNHVDVNAIDAEATILAGDIGVGLAGLQWALAIDRPVIYVMGNHEFFGQRPMGELRRKAREKVDGTHVHLLENDAVILDDPASPGEPVRFLGCTLWTDFAILGPEKQEECMEAAGRSMTDYSAIYVSRRGRSLVEYGYSGQHYGDRLTPRRTLALHHESRDFLERGLARQPDPLGLAETWSRTVVVTHHESSAKSLTYGVATGHGDAAYASDLGNLVCQADLWGHGHTHVAADYRIEGGPGTGRVVANQRGYVGDELVDEFDPCLVVEV
jgi:hypothetical protein